MKKYMFIIPSLSKGGAERVVSILSSELVKKENAVTIITHFKTEYEYPVNKGVKIVCLSDMKECTYREKMSILFLIKLLYILRKKVKQEDPDYILPFLWTTCIRAELSLIFSKYNKRIIQTVRNNPSIFPQNRILRKYRDFLVKKSKMSLVQNKEQKDYFDFNLKNKIKILPNPVSEEILNIKRENDNNTINIIGVGRLEKQKKFELLIKAFAEISSKNKNVRLKIYGDGTQKENLQKLINELQIQDIAKLCGRANNYSTIYSSASIYVLSSDFEGMPNTLLEAMAVGLPCISTNCPTGPSDIIVNGENGLLINRNSISELIESIEKIIKNEEFREKISKNAKNTIKQKYSSDMICKMLIEYCEQI